MVSVVSGMVAAVVVVVVVIGRFISYVDSQLQELQWGMTEQNILSGANRCRNTKNTRHKMRDRNVSDSGFYDVVQSLDGGVWLLETSDVAITRLMT